MGIQYDITTIDDFMQIMVEGGVLETTRLRYWEKADITHPDYDCLSVHPRIEKVLIKRCIKRIGHETWYDTGGWRMVSSEASKYRFSYTLPEAERLKLEARIEREWQQELKYLNGAWYNDMAGPL